MHHYKVILLKYSTSGIHHFLLCLKFYYEVDYEHRCVPRFISIAIGLLAVNRYAAWRVLCFIVNICTEKLDNKKDE